MTELSGRLHTWMASGRFTAIDGVDIWHRVEGRGPWLVCLHGFPTSSRDWQWLLPLLAGHYRMLIFDLPGFGLSGKPPGRDYSLVRQFDTVAGLLRSLEIERFHLLAHDMGDSLACELLYRMEQDQGRLRAETVSLLNGGIYMDLHRPLPTQRLLRTRVLGEFTARLAGWSVFRHQFPRVYAEPDLFDEEHYREQWQLMLHNGGRRVLAKVSGYMRERVRHGARWLRPLERLQIPLQLVWGMEDPIAVPAIAERLLERNPQATLVRLDGVGHYPQLEAPERTAAAIVRFIDSTSRVAGAV